MISFGFRRVISRRPIQRLFHSNPSQGIIFPGTPLPSLQESNQISSNFVPYVVDNTPGSSERVYDIYSRLLVDRIILLFGPVNNFLASKIIAQLLFLESQDTRKPIHIYINSPGGSVSDGLAIYDTMRYMTCPVSTVCMGMAASMGSFLLAGGTPGHRFALPNAKIMLHQPSGGAQGQASDIAIVAEEILKTRAKLNSIYQENTGQALNHVEKVMERDTWMSAEEALAFGLIDKIIDKKVQEENERCSNS